MIVFTALAPSHSTDNLDRSDRTLFLSDKFWWPAFWFGPLWLGLIRNWSGLLIWIVGLVLVLIAETQHQIDSSMIVFALLGSAFFLGLEGSRLREQSLLRRGYRIVGLLEAKTVHEAEEIYFRSKASAFQRLDDYIDKSTYYSSDRDMFPMLESGR